MTEEYEVITLPIEFFGNPIKIRKEMKKARLMKTFRDRDHARQVWDDWDGVSYDNPSAEDAHQYLNLIGDGSYCAV